MIEKQPTSILDKLSSNGIQSFSDLSKITEVSVNTLKNWMKKRPVVFDILISNSKEYCNRGANRVDMRVYRHPHKNSKQPYMVSVDTVQEGVYMMDAIQLYHCDMRQTSIANDYPIRLELQMLQGSSWVKWHDYKTKCSDPIDYIKQARLQNIGYNLKY